MSSDDFDLQDLAEHWQQQFAKPENLQRMRQAFQAFGATLQGGRMPSIRQSISLARTLGTIGQPRRMFGAGTVIVTTLIALGVLAGVFGPVLKTDFGLPTLPVTKRLFPQASGFSAADVEAVLAPDGTVAVRESVHLEDGGSVSLLGPCPADGSVPTVACVRDVQVDGRPVAPAASGSGVSVQIDGEDAVLSYTADGLAMRFTDVSILAWPVLPQAFGNTGPFDPRVTLRGRLRLPRAPEAPSEIHLHSAGERSARLEGDAVVFEGDTALYIRAIDLQAAFPAGLLPDIPDERTFGGPGILGFRIQQQVEDQLDASFAAVPGEVTTPREVFNLIIFAFAVAPALALWILVLVRLVRRITHRRPKLDLPKYEEQPPTNHDPAVVAALAAEGKLPPEAVAGAVLSLAERKRLDIQDLPGEHFVMRVVPGAIGDTPGEGLLLAVLASKAAQTGGKIEGPPLWDGKVGFWKSFRKDALRRVARLGLAERADTTSLAGVALIVTIGSILVTFLLPSPFLFFTFAVMLPILAAVVTFRLGYALTEEGRLLRERWLAFGRHVRERTQMGNVPPAGVVIWGPYLTYGTVLDAAPKAAEQLSPQV
ncbi:MAG TPA: DUF2207 domain-containing protein [Actinomycetota bacterium]|nr:DUF2207 domain-containing protein [Actinomycetota bacterium]